MCNLYASTMPQDTMRRLFDVSAGRDRLGNAEPVPAIFPKHQAPIVRLGGDGGRELVSMHWGFVLPQTSKKTGKPIQPKAVTNTRDDTVRSSGFWKRHFAHRRCLIPASSFAEPQGRTPAIFHWFDVDGRAPFAFAGIWQHYQGPYGDAHRELDVFSMLTTEPNERVAPVHPSRMPVILDAGDYATWLHGDTDAAAALLRPFPAERMAVIAAGADAKAEPDAPLSPSGT